MVFDIYCDESRQDLLVRKESITQHNRFVCIGGLMVPREQRKILKEKIINLKVKHSVFGELKWGNVSNNKMEFYLELIDLFFEHEEVTFRTVVIDATEIDNEVFNQNDHELGYYKFYYQLLAHWIECDDTYCVFTDFKTNKDRNRLNELKNICNKIYHKDNLAVVQAINSKESLLLQLQNVIMGAIGYKFNFGESGTAKAKIEVVKRIEYKLGQPLSPTDKVAKKVNIFKINLKKGGKRNEPS